MSIIPLGPFEPDSAGVDMRDANGGVVLQVAKNVFPSRTGYIPIQALSAITASALPDTCFGLAYASTAPGGIPSGYVIFAATRTKLYKYDTGTNAWVDYTRVAGGNYNLSSDDYWSFTQFGSLLIACNINDDVQVIDVDTGATAFSALGGTPPRARYVTVVGDFVVLACLSSNNRKVRNSAINSAVGWTVGTSLCDEQEFPDGGRVTGVAGGEFGWVMQETAIRRMDFHAGSDVAFSFERVEKEKGAAAGYSVVSTINAVFFFSNDGFYAFGKEGLRPIGAGRINAWFKANSDTARFFSIIAFADPYAPRIAWAFFNSAGSTTFDRLLIYDWQLDRWSYAQVSAQFWVTSVTAGLTLEGLDIYGSIDTGVPYSLDSRVWQGGRPVIGAINTAGLLSFLEGSLPLDATLTTTPLRITPSGRTNVASVEAIGVFNGADLSIRVGRRERSQDSVNYTAAITPSSTSGIARTKASGRLHEVETTLTQTAGTLWTHIQGLDIIATPDGRK